jgi:ABC-2 type transport system ATP-binding protein
VGAEPDGSSVTLDGTVFAPSTGGQHPAVLLAHGFGGTKAELVGQARDFAARGYLVLTYTARGFGSSGGRIHLNDPAYEVADARALIDTLAARQDVRQDAPGDPRVAVVGASYGGALALMTGATDPRVDTVAAAITWNDLADAFFPQNVTQAATPSAPAQVDRISQPGPLKQLWASRFLASAAAAGAAPTGSPPSSAAPANPACGRFDPGLCRLFLPTAETGQPSADLLAMLRAHSPKALVSSLKAPTYLIQGMTDSLFGLDQADATARTLTAQGTPVAVRWIDGGHDGLSSTAEEDEQALDTWLAHYLAPAVPDDSSATATADTALPVAAFMYAVPIPRRAEVAPLLSAPSYVGSASWSSIPLAAGPAQPVLSPAGGQPASLTTIPGARSLTAGAGSLAANLPAYQLAALPGQFAAFDSAPITEQTVVVGAPHARLTVTSSGSPATFYLSLWQVTSGVATLPRPLVAPVTVPTTPGVPTTVDVALPAATWRLESGSSVRLLVASTDSGFTGSRTARVDQVRLAEARLSVPTVSGTVVSGGGQRDLETVGVAAAIAVALLALAGSAWWQRRRRQHDQIRPDLADVPLVVEHLVKTYPDGHRAVDDVSWLADRGQVVGLLGPNGAGKTTTLRMVMGLIQPDSGTVHVLGEPIRAGAPVLARVGALIEGPGFLPHLTGRDNLRAYWAATGRVDADARFDEVLEVAALGDAIDRPVRSYSHGMRQRLGIAQAMLGMPEVLVLDEPTNGLDPPQIAAMRPILHRYAASGRTVVISSHLLGEVEMTCSHVVVMHAGRVVTSGTVAELVDSADTTVVLLGPGEDAGALAERLLGVEGITGVDVDDDPLEPRLVITAELARADVVRAVADTGADIVGVTSRRHLEEVFLGVIAQASSSTGDSSDGSRSLTDRLRQVRSR